MKAGVFKTWVTILVLSISVPTAGAGIFEEGFGGALSGAMLGSLLGGRDGARTGAIIGGAAGVIRGANQKEQMQRQEEAYRRQIDERERLMLRQQQRQRQWQAQRHSQATVRTEPGGTGTTPAIDTRLIIEIQKSLVRIGIDPGDINGELHEATVSAIKEYERTHGLLVTGRPSQELLKHMLVNGG